MPGGRGAHHARVLGDAGRSAPARESGRDDTDVERERGALDAVERALLRGAFRSRDDDESDDEVVLLRGALKAERLRAAALAKEARRTRCGRRR